MQRLTTEPAKVVRMVLRFTHFSGYREHFIYDEPLCMRVATLSNADVLQQQKNREPAIHVSVL